MKLIADSAHSRRKIFFLLPCWQAGDSCEWSGYDGVMIVLAYGFVVGHFGVLVIDLLFLYQQSTMLDINNSSWDRRLRISYYFPVVD